MRIRGKIPLLAALIVAAMSQARAADITTDLGVIGPVLPDYDTNYNIAELVLVDQSGIAGLNGQGVPGTQVYGYNLETSQIYSIAPTTGVFDFNFSVAKESILDATVSAYQSPDYGSASADLFLGSTLLESNVNSISTFLKPDVNYTIAVTGTVPDFPVGFNLGAYTIYGKVSPVPVPAALPLLATAIAGLASLNLRRKRKSLNRSEVAAAGT